MRSRGISFLLAPLGASQGVSDQSYQVFSPSFLLEEKKESQERKIKIGEKMEYLESNLKSYLFSFCDLRTLISLSEASRYLRQLIYPLLSRGRTKYYLGKNLDPGLESVKRNDLKYFIYLDRNGYCFSKCVLPRILLLNRKEFLTTSKIFPLSDLHLAHCLQTLAHTRSREMIELFKVKIGEFPKLSLPISIRESSSFMTSYFPRFCFHFDDDYRLLVQNFDVELFTMSRYRKEYKSRLIIQALASCDPDIVDFVLTNVSKGKFLDICIWNEYHLEIDHSTARRIAKYYQTPTMGISQAKPENFLNRIILNMFIVSNKFFIRSLADGGWHPDQEFLKMPFELEYYPSFNIGLVTKINRDEILDRLKLILPSNFSPDEAQKILQKIEESISVEMES